MSFSFKISYHFRSPLSSRAFCWCSAWQQSPFPVVISQFPFTLCSVCDSYEVLQFLPCLLYTFISTINEYLWWYHFPVRSAGTNAIESHLEQFTKQIFAGCQIKNQIHWIKYIENYQKEEKTVTIYCWNSKNTFLLMSQTAFTTLCSTVLTQQKVIKTKKSN